MDLIACLPLLAGWSYATKDVEYPGFTVPAGEEHVITEQTKPGWAYTGMVHLNHKLATFEITLYDPYRGKQVIRMQPAGMYAGGAVSPNPVGPWLSVYDEVGDNYVIIFAPSILPPYAFRWRLAVRAPPDAPVQVVSLSYAMICIEEPEKFAQSLRELLKGRGE